MSGIKSTIEQKAAGKLRSAVSLLVAAAATLPAGAQESGAQPAENIAVLEEDHLPVPEERFDTLLVAV